MTIDRRGFLTLAATAPVAMAAGGLVVAGDGCAYGPTDDQKMVIAMRQFTGAGDLEPAIVFQPLRRTAR